MQIKKSPSKVTQHYTNILYNIGLNVDYLKKYRGSYSGQKYKAKNRNIEWQFTFESWIIWWGIDITKRGHKRGQLVMARYKDQGPYHPDNVRKATCSENVKEGQLQRDNSYSQGKTWKVIENKRVWMEKETL